MANRLKIFFTDLDLLPPKFCVELNVPPSPKQIHLHCRREGF